MNNAICLKCGTFAKIERTGATLLEKLRNRPYRLWSFDLYKCPSCQALIVSGIGREPIAEHFEPTFDATVVAHQVLKKEAFFEVSE